jgi:hypothetical protein
MAEVAFVEQLLPITDEIDDQGRLPQHEPEPPPCEYFDYAFGASSGGYVDTLAIIS